MIDIFPENKLSDSFEKFYQIGAWCFVVALIFGAIWLEVISELIAFVLAQVQF